MRHIDLGERNTPENGQSGGGRNRIGTVCTMNGAGTIHRRTGSDPVNAHTLHSDAGTDDIDDGIDRADLVKMNLFDRFAMNGGLGFADPAKDRDRALLHRTVQSAGFDHIADGGERTSVMVMAVGMTAMAVMMMAVVVAMIVRVVRGNMHLDMNPGDGAALSAGNLDFIGVGKTEQGQIVPEVPGLQPQIDHRGEKHVAADPRYAVDVQFAHVANVPGVDDHAKPEPEII